MSIGAVSLLNSTANVASSSSSASTSKTSSTSSCKLGKDVCDNCGSCSQSTSSTNKNVSSDGDTFQMSAAGSSFASNGLTATTGVSSVDNQSTNSLISNALEAYNSLQS